MGAGIRMMFIISISSYLGGCAGGGVKTGVDVADLTVSDCLSARPSPPSADVAASPDTGSVASVLHAAAAGAGAVSVTHDGVGGSCCVGFDVAAETDEAAATVSVTYEETGEPCDCICTYNLAYTLTGLSAGDWTIEAAGDSTTVTVE